MGPLSIDEERLILSLVSDYTWLRGSFIPPLDLYMANAIYLSKRVSAVFSPAERKDA